MPGIQDFLSLASSQLGMTEETTRSATGGLLSFIGDKANPQDFQSLLGALPGAEALTKSAGKPSGGGGGLKGAISGLAGSAGLGKFGAAAGLLAKLKGSGMDMDQAGPFVGMFIDFAKKNVDGALIGKILESVPDLKKVLA
ncbi:DUF2780 domain-containing protein [bacterium]|nr:DUF2780 domain-containing protein [bacterium]